MHIIHTINDIHFKKHSRVGSVHTSWYVLICTLLSVLFIVMEQEIWKAAPGFEGYYEISNLNRIRSLPYSYKMPNGSIVNRPGKVRVNQIGKTSYWVVMIRNRDEKENKIKCIKLHRLIAKVFIPNPENLPCINHIDGNSLNNNIDNLEWCSHKYNIQHAFRTGLVPKVYGENTTNSKLTAEQVLFIYNTKFPYKKYKELFGVKNACIHSIKSGRTWSHLTGKVA